MTAPTPTVEAAPLAPNWLENIRGLANGLMTERSYVAPGCVLEQRGREIAYLLQRYEALSTPSQTTGVVTDWVLVPAEATRQMRHATWKADYLDGGATEAEAAFMAANREADQDEVDGANAAYRAMLSARPAPPIHVGGAESQELSPTNKAILAANLWSDGVDRALHTMSSAALGTLLDAARQEGRSPSPATGGVETGEPVGWMIHWKDRPCIGGGERKEVIYSHYPAVESRVQGLQTEPELEFLRVVPLYASPVPAAGPTLEDVARKLAEIKGHRDVEAEIVLDDGSTIPVWRCYLADARPILTLFAGAGR